MTNPIDRKTAEAARRNVLELDRTVIVLTDAQLIQRNADCKLWNEFCAQETARLDAKPLSINPTVALFGG